MRVSWGRVKPGAWHEYEARYREVIDSGLASYQGLEARWLLRDLDDADSGFTVSLWKTAESMEAYSSDSRVRAQIRHKFEDLFVGEIETRLCEVRT